MGDLKAAFLALLVTPGKNGLWAKLLVLLGRCLGLQQRPTAPNSIGDLGLSWPGSGFTHLHCLGSQGKGELVAGISVFRETLEFFLSFGKKEAPDPPPGPSPSPKHK